MEYANVLIILLFTLYFNFCESLECYVCKDQENNLDKCLTTIKTCEQGEDACLTEVKWGTMPYWRQGADKQYYISKSCSTRQQCEKTRTRSMRFCTHIWYEDWKCVECCQGDRCNYYVILGGSTARGSFLMLMAGLAVIIVSILPKKIRSSARSILEKRGKQINLSYERCMEEGSCRRCRMKCEDVVKEGSVAH